MASLPSHMIAPIALMMYCGLDPQDALALPRSAIKDGRIDTHRGKTGQSIWLPIPRPLADALANAPTHDSITICANSLGRPWTTSGFRSSWRKVKLDLEKSGEIEVGLTLMGLRHTVATILAEMGYGPEAIRNVLGQKTDSMARLYSKRADKTKLNAATMENFEVELNKRSTKIVKPR